MLENGGGMVNDTYELEFYQVKKRQELLVNNTLLVSPGTLTKLDPHAQHGEIDNPFPLSAYLDVQTEESLVIEKSQGFSPASGLYDNLPESEKC